MSSQQRVILPDPTKMASYDLSHSTVCNDDVSGKNRRIFVGRHAERVDFVFGEWIPPCFDQSGKYVRKDSNMPKRLPNRINSPRAWLLDSPITNIGLCQAKLTGDAMKEAGGVVSYAYCSPSYRCVQTCQGILEVKEPTLCSIRDCSMWHQISITGLGLTHIKIRIEFALFEWMLFYRDNKPEWCTKEELYADKFNIDMEYESMMTKDELLKSKNENCEEFYYRNHSVVENFLRTHGKTHSHFSVKSETQVTVLRYTISRPLPLEFLTQWFSFCFLIFQRQVMLSWLVIHVRRKLVLAYWSVKTQGKRRSSSVCCKRCHTVVWSWQNTRQSKMNGN